MQLFHVLFLRQTIDSLTIVFISSFSTRLIYLLLGRSEQKFNYIILPALVLLKNTCEWKLLPSNFHLLNAKHPQNQPGLPIKFPDILKYILVVHHNSKRSVAIAVPLARLQIASEIESGILEVSIHCSNFIMEPSHEGRPTQSDIREHTHGACTSQEMDAYLQNPCAPVEFHVCS